MSRRHAVAERETRVGSALHIVRRALRLANEPCKLTLVRTPPQGPQWLHEIKWDGYRVSAYLKDGAVRIMTSSGLDWGRSVSSDRRRRGGSACAQRHHRRREAGRPYFGDLQVASGGTAVESKIQLFAFDLLYYDGTDIRAWPLDRRRTVLEGLVGDDHGTALVLSEEFDVPSAYYAAQSPEPPNQET